jgi:ssDNA thymidine ADP-ribosyltransferase, DarT
MARPDTIWLYRMIHVHNLPHILQHGLVVASHPDADPGFRSIGDQGLIGVRKDLNAPDPPGGTFSEYIPFYLGHRSPMLYQIAKGYENIEKIPQSDIVYIVVQHECVVQNELAYFFTDGHARHGMTQFYTDAAGFDALDWEAIYATQWRNTEDDSDRQRKKQAEYMIKGRVPVSCFAYFLTFDEESKQKVESLQASAKTVIPVKVSKTAYYDHL